MSTLRTTKLTHKDNSGVANIILNVDGSSTGGRSTTTSDAALTLTTKDYVDTNGGSGGGVIYNGPSAWGNVAVDGTINGSLNIASVTVNGSEFDILFSTPMPDANYAIVATTLDTSAPGDPYYKNVTPAGFSITSKNPGGTAFVSALSFTVFATNALPPKGGTGTDAWGAVQADGTIDASFNVASVTKSATGTYDVVFTSPMPSSSYAVAVNIMEDANSTSTKFTAYYNLTTTGFSIKTKGTSNFADLNFSFSVNATNAVLPATFTATQITNMISGLTAIKNAALNNSTDLAGMKASIAAALANF